MAVDMLVSAYEDICDTIFLISSDTDLIPAITKAKERGKEIMCVGFSHKPSKAMKVNCSKSILLNKTQFNSYIIKP